jgi:hypothetical protein
MSRCLAVAAGTHRSYHVHLLRLGLYIRRLLAERRPGRQKGPPSDRRALGYAREVSGSTRLSCVRVWQVVSGWFLHPCEAQRASAPYWCTPGTPIGQDWPGARVRDVFRSRICCNASPLPLSTAMADRDNPAEAARCSPYVCRLDLPLACKPILSGTYPKPAPT